VENQSKEMQTKNILGSTAFHRDQFAEKEKLWRKKQKHNPVSGSPGAPERTSSDRKNLGSISHQDWV